MISSPIRVCFKLDRASYRNLLIYLEARFQDRRKDEFLAVLGHELRNLLSPIRNAVQILSLQESLPEKVR